MKLQTIFKCSVVYFKYTSRRNDLMNVDVVDLNSSKSLRCDRQTGGLLYLNITKIINRLITITPLVCWRSPVQGARSEQSNKNQDSERNRDYRYLR